MIDIPRFINVDLDEPVEIDPDQDELIAEGMLLQAHEMMTGK